MADALKLEQLSRALDVRDVIGQAKGILMERFRLTDQRAFTVLMRISQHENVKLVDVARHLVETGELLGRAEDPLRSRVVGTGGGCRRRRYALCPSKGCFQSSRLEAPAPRDGDDRACQGTCFRRQPFGSPAACPIRANTLRIGVTS